MLDKKAEGNVKSLVLAIVIGSLILLSGVTLTTKLMAEYGYDQPSDFTVLNDTSHLSDEWTDGLVHSQDAVNRTLIQKITDRIQDTWFGKTLSTVALVLDSYSLLTQYVFTLGGILNIPTYILTFVEVILFLTALFAFIYFVRSGK